MILTVTANASIDKRYLMSEFRSGSVNRVKECTMIAGGKGLNVAHATHTAGEKTIATGFLGGDHGRFVQKALQEEGIGEDFIWCQGETRSCINIWDESKKQQTELLEPGLTVTDADQIALAEKFQWLIQKADIASISGSIPRGADSSLYERLIVLGKKAGKRVILDTSGKTLLESVHYAPYMIKPNVDEIRQLVGSRLDENDHTQLFEAAEEIRSLGIAVVVISLGSQGALLSCKEGRFEARVPAVDAVNTVGCGDAMTGGFCIGIGKGLPMEECLRLASSISTASAMTDRTGFFRREDQKALYHKIQILQMG